MPNDLDVDLDRLDELLDRLAAAADWPDPGDMARLMARLEGRLTELDASLDELLVLTAVMTDRLGVLLDEAAGMRDQVAELGRRIRELYPLL